ncbi:hypothetical protein SAMN05192541_120141 [Bradyrhizobium arachidis]|nr:hypothetical protein SAMN05192541_120141 [Bradyrhizobium arachidis]
MTSMTPSLARSRYYFHSAKFVARKHLRGYVINSAPTLDPDGLSCFQTAIQSSRVYLEYGCGGTTLVAARHVSKLISVETDRVFAKAVAASLPRSEANITILTPNLGPTREWGYPIFDRPTPSHIARWQRFPKAPWAVIDEPPDLVLIDSRMRVACALESLLHVSVDTRILVDDYSGRDYSLIERFADLIAMHGRMAEFRPRRTFDQDGCRLALQERYSDLN